MLVDLAVPVLVVHHELDQVEELARLAARLVVARALEASAKLLPVERAVVVVVDLPQNHGGLLAVEGGHARRLGQLVELEHQVLEVDLAVAVLVEALEDAPGAGRAARARAAAGGVSGAGRRGAQRTRLPRCGARRT